MLDNGFSVSMNAGFAGACDEDTDEFDPSLNCRKDSEDPTKVRCIEGYEWEDPNDPNNLKCIPKKEQPQSASTGTSSAPPTSTMYVTASALNVRLGPSTKYKSVGTISKNTEVQAVQGYPALLQTPQGMQVGDDSGAFASPTKDNWVYVTQIQSAGVVKEGWVSGKYLAAKPAPVINSNTTTNTNETTGSDTPNVTQNNQGQPATKLSMVGLVMLAGAAYLFFKSTK